jgi:hypothetical protein
MEEFNIAVPASFTADLCIGPVDVRYDKYFKNIDLGEEYTGSREKGDNILGIRIIVADFSKRRQDTDTESVETDTKQI